MRIVPFPPGDTGYCSWVYWVLGDGFAPGDPNTLIDAGSDPRTTTERIITGMSGCAKGIGKKAVEQVFLTHDHYDHSGGLSALREAFDPVVCAGAPGPGIDRVLHDGQLVRIGDRDFKVLRTPGHSDDSICLFCEDEGVLFSGDTQLSIQVPGGAYSAAFLATLDRLASLPIRVAYPGHGPPLRGDVPTMIRTTIGVVRCTRHHH